MESARMLGELIRTVMLVLIAAAVTAGSVPAHGVVSSGLGDD